MPQASALQVEQNPPRPRPDPPQDKGGGLATKSGPGKQLAGSRAQCVFGDAAWWWGAEGVSESRQAPPLLADDRTHGAWASPLE